MDKEVFEIARFVHGGVETSVAVEETPRLRRVCITRSRMMFGEPKKVGEVHIYVDEVRSYVQALLTSGKVMDFLGEGEGGPVSARSYLKALGTGKREVADAS